MAPDVVADVIEVEEVGEQVLDLVREVLPLSYNSPIPPLFSGEEAGGLRLYMMMDRWKSLRLDWLKWVGGSVVERAGLEAGLGEERV
jgi:hypothetical protein